MMFDKKRTVNIFRPVDVYWVVQNVITNTILFNYLHATVLLNIYVLSFLTIIYFVCCGQGEQEAVDNEKCYSKSPN